MQRRIQRRLSLAVSLAVLGLSAACTNSPSSSSSTGTFNDADVAFATQMIPHHAQAIRMAKMALSNGSSQQVIDLATTIQNAQQPEVDLMNSWLKAWGKPSPDAATGGMDGMGHDNMNTPTMTGMMTAQEIHQLNRTPSGPAFDHLWLQMMIKHHHGAIDMATIELHDGQNADAKALARQIISTQQKEITTMNRLLDSGTN